jgi:hypothetical protein
VAQHGYLREYDEGSDRSDDGDRNWDDRERERGWRGNQREWSDRDRGLMFDRNRDRSSDEDDRNFVDRIGDRARSWFRDDDRQYRGTHENDWANRGQSSSGYGREHGFGGFQGDYSRTGRMQGGFGGRGDWERSPRNFSSHQDDHYRSWRDRQMDALDRDYADYCREREQQFHSDFDTWRRNRQPSGGQQPSQGSDATGQAGELELTHERALGEQGNTPSPVGEATLGTNNSENTGRGRR